MRQLIEHAASDYAVFMVTALLGLLFLAIYVFMQSDKKSDLSFPGLKSSDPELGNLLDIKKAGSLHEFLVGLHKKHGPIVSFWWGKELSVTVASPELWKDLIPLFDRPVAQFQLFEPLIGKSSIQYANFAGGKKHRALIDRCFGHSQMLEFIHKFNGVSKELSTKWTQSAKTEEHIPLRQQMFACALKSILNTSFGESLSNKEIMQFEESYDYCWGFMEDTMNGCVKDQDKAKARFDKDLKFLRGISRRVLTDRRSADTDEKSLLIDEMIDDTAIYADDEAIIDNIITNIIGGFHTTGNLLTWIFYYLAEHPDCEASVYDEIKTVLPDDHEDVTMDDIAAMPYLRNVLDEAMRCSVLAPWAARFSEYDSVVGGHTIPKETPIILALGVVLQDESIWPSPSKFDPSRFSPSAKKDRHPLAYSPFGFAGKRKCPGYRFAYCESSVMVAQIVRKFRVKLVPGQSVEKVYGLVTQPKEEIWVTIEKR